MATFDQLPAEQRAILELVVGRGQTYEELSGMLGMPSSRVRELAREALDDLAPATAARVDSDWRGQIADYVLGQQSGPESTATKGHLKHSEAARAWAYSLLDSLSHLYPNGGAPEIPDAGNGADASAPPTQAAPPPPADATPPREPKPAPAPRPSRPTGAGLSPAAQAIVRRRRIIGGALALAVIVVAILAILGVFSGGSSNKNASNGNTSTTGGVSTRIVADGVLRSVGGANGTGVAVVIQQGGQYQLVIQATRLQPTTRRNAYEVWLYNSSTDTVPVGAQFTDQQGNLQGRGAVPANWRRYKYVVLSSERVGTNPKTPAAVKLRATLAPVRNGTTGAGGTTGP